MNIDPKLRKALTGISGILVTPFDAQDRVAPAKLKPIIDRAIGAGVHLLVANGNTGEFYGLTTAEAETMVHAVAEMMRFVDYSPEPSLERLAAERRAEAKRSSR